MRVVVITGGNSGIGLETANLFRKNGDIVIVISKNVEEDQLNFKCDVSNYEQVKQVFEKISKLYNKIDILINNAGYGISGASELLPNSQVQNLFDVNVMGVINCTQCALPFMNKGGKVINIGSAMAFFPLPFRTMYASSKIAVVNLSYGLRMELKDFGIDVCVICPGDVKTNFTKNRIKNFETNEKYGQRIKNAAESLDSKEDKRMPASYVAQKIFNVCNKTKIKPLVIVGNKYKLLYFVQRFFPINLILNVIEKNFGGYKK